MHTLPVHIEISDVTARRPDGVGNDVQVTLYDTQVGGDKRLPLFQFTVDRGQLAATLNDTRGTGFSGAMRTYSVLGKMLSS